MDRVLTVTESAFRPSFETARRSSSATEGSFHPPSSSQRRLTDAHGHVPGRQGVEWQDQWVAVWQSLSCEAYVRVEDGGLKGRLAEHEYPDCQVAIEVIGDDIITNSRRRMVISWRSSDQQLRRHTFWLPATDVKVAQTECLVEIQFSNCKQKSNTTRDHVNNYEAIYKPATPNIYVRLQFKDVEEAKELRARILHLWGPSAPNKTSEIFFPGHCTVRSEQIKSIDGKDLGNGLFVWTHVIDGETGKECTALDFGCFTSRLDFEVKTQADTLVLYVRHFKKVKYMPADIGKYPYWPPPKVEENKAGAPAVMKFGLNTEDDALVLRCPIDKATGLFNAAFNLGPNAVVRRWSVVKFLINPKRFGLTRPKTGLLAMLEIETHLYAILRTADSTEKKESDESTSQQRWRALLWRSDSQSSATCIEEKKIVIEDVDTMTGNYLSLDLSTMLQPQIRDKDSEPRTWERTKIELRFDTVEDCTQLLALLNEFGFY